MQAIRESESRRKPEWRKKLIEPYIAKYGIYDFSEYCCGMDDYKIEDLCSDTYGICIFTDINVRRCNAIKENVKIIRAKQEVMINKVAELVKKRSIG